ncbi:MAG TPA: PilZ domain-containing protein [Bryobacteraceae bacterium]|nr:PilZ domain-containing protein [Bryobacteraceae bacterium]
MVKHDKNGVRRQDRERVTDRIQVSWPNRNGGENFSAVEAFDISDTGMSFMLNEELPQATYVTVRSLTLGVQGRAVVRHVARKGIKNLIGVEFTGGFHWKTKPAGHDSI